MGRATTETKVELLSKQNIFGLCGWTRVGDISERWVYSDSLTCGKKIGLQPLLFILCSLFFSDGLIMCSLYLRIGN